MEKEDLLPDEVIIPTIRIVRGSSGEYQADANVPQSAQANDYFEFFVGKEEDRIRDLAKEEMRWVKLERAYKRACGVNGITPNGMQKVIQHYKEIRATLNLGIGYRGNDQEWEPKAPDRAFRGNSVIYGTNWCSEVSLSAYHFQQSVFWAAFNEEPIYTDSAGNITAPTMPGEPIEVGRLNRNGGTHPDSYLDYVEKHMTQWERIRTKKNIA